jgi:FAD synthase
MQILKGLPSFPPELRPSVAALGAFDGIHLAHAKILDTAVARARAL